MSVLPHTITVLAGSAKVALRGCEVTRVVLRHFQGELHPFVVHYEVFPADRESFFVEGGYYEDIEPALEDFKRRAHRDLARQKRELEQDNALLADIRAL